MIARFNRRLSVQAIASKMLILWLTAFGAFAITSAATTKGCPSARQIRKLITHMAGLALPSGAVRIKRSSPVDSSTIEATALLLKHLDRDGPETEVALLTRFDRLIAEAQPARP